MDKSQIRVLVVDDYEPWRRHFSTTLRKQQGLQVVGEVSDGLEAVQKAEELQPDLVLLDIGLPRLNGIEAARRIRKVSAATKIVLVSGSSDIAEVALKAGACGCVVKWDASRELLPVVKAVLEGKRFVSSSSADCGSSGLMNDHATAATHCHEVAFYADETSMVDGYARFIEIALESGHAVIVVVTEPHRASLLAKLEADGVDVPAVMEQGRCVLLDTADMLSRLTVDDMPDPIRCAKLAGDLIPGAAKSVKAANGRVAVCGEIAPILLSKGNGEGAIQLERLWDEITRGYGIHALCCYLWSAFPEHEADPVFQRICREHEAVHEPDQAANRLAAF